jgi:uncharacterized membrane-anchored protein
LNRQRRRCALTEADPAKEAHVFSPALHKTAPFVSECGDDAMSQRVSFRPGDMQLRGTAAAPRRSRTKARTETPSEGSLRVTPAIDRRMLNKVPLVTVAFWIIKILATTVGETGADFLNFRLGLGLVGTSVAMLVLLGLFLALQMRQDRYVPWIYWMVVVFLSIVGTLLTDNLSDNLGVSLFASTAAFALALSATFILWYRSERTLSIHDITTTRREAYYWAAILFTFALGTASGDLVAEQLGLGYVTAALIFGGAIALITLGYYAVGLNSVLAFWLAYILTRPLGASLGDLLTQSKADGGLALGTMPVSGVFLVVIVTLVIYLSVRGERDRSASVAAESSAPGA